MSDGSPLPLHGDARTMRRETPAGRWRDGSSGAALAKLGALGKFKNTGVGEEPLQLKSQDSAFFVEFRRHMAIFGKLYILAEIAEEQRTKK